MARSEDAYRYQVCKERPVDIWATSSGKPPSLDDLSKSEFSSEPQLGLTLGVFDHHWSECQFFSLSFYRQEKKSIVEVSCIGLHFLGFENRNPTNLVIDKQARQPDRPYYRVNDMSQKQPWYQFYDLQFVDTITYLTFPEHRSHTPSTLYLVIIDYGEKRKSESWSALFTFSFTRVSWGLCLWHPCLFQKEYLPGSWWLRRSQDLVWDIRYWGHFGRLWAELRAGYNRNPNVTKLRNSCNV